jgi:predicted AAA+ superfamily ATPase
MIPQYNPFKENRTEQMKELWKYYVPIPGINDSAKPIIIEGGRGSGKTMLFMCNSWRDKLEQTKQNENTVNVFIEDEPFIGLYYKVDTAFVSAMIGKNRDDWEVIFETYLSICLLREILYLLKSLYLENQCQQVKKDIAQKPEV